MSKIFEIGLHDFCIKSVMTSKNYIQVEVKHFSHSNRIRDSHKLSFEARFRRAVKREACMHF